MLHHDLSPAALRETFGHYPSGVAALCSIVDGAPEGIVASTFTVGVSVDPPLVVFAAQNNSRTWPLIRDSKRVGVSAFAADQADICRQIAAKTGDRFAGTSLTTTAFGASLLDEAGKVDLAWSDHRAPGPRQGGRALRRPLPWLTEAR